MTCTICSSNTRTRTRHRGCGLTAAKFVGGIALACWLYTRHSEVDGRQVDSLAFLLFVGAARATTAFPVLARIVTDCGLREKRDGWSRSPR